MEVIAIFIALLILGVLAARFGANSLDGRDWQPRPEYWAFPHRDSFPRESRQRVGREPDTHLAKRARLADAETCAPVA